ncbi:hypothetical protein CAI21_22510 [Alkalilimnicola ehrlichii]|uniref:Transmembrane protein n=1 Tax=Alkalilimnicola ehrlichii TaxID=351052 RepID=A0A3E0WHY6_9GAMM|nr:hypothetical protein [Alkalilimnicola ehrlichii]RFA24200.1 hypothetical protein CAI21_22510 [Alkalilimnicola ehrlichii]RFA30852.1 hypothetical protein CAL65_22660 [Alkalilimnicola ehrlichii]
MSLSERLQMWRRKLFPLIQLSFPDWRTLKAPTPGLRPLPKNRMPTNRQLTGRFRGEWLNGMFDCDGRYLLWRTETPQFWTNKPDLLYMGLMLSTFALLMVVIMLFAYQWLGALISLFAAVALFGMSLFIRFGLSPATGEVAIFDRKTGLVYLPLPHRCGPMVCRFKDLKAYYVTTVTLALHSSGGVELIPEVLPPGAPDRGFRLGMDSYSIGYSTEMADPWWSVVQRFMTSPEAAPWRENPDWARRVGAYRRLGLTIPELYPEGLTRPFPFGTAFGDRGWSEHVEEYFARQGRALPSDWPAAYVIPEALVQRAQYSEPLEARLKYYRRDAVDEAS